MGAKFLIKNNIRLKALNKTSAKATEEATEKIATAMLEFMVNGSPKSAATAPIRWGVLRASASVFVGNKLIALSPNVPNQGTATPNKSYSGKRNHVTVGFNTPYATRQHEDKSMKPGKFSALSGSSNPGNQWVMEHLKKDGPDLMKVAAEVMKEKF